MRTVPYDPSQRARSSSPRLGPTVFVPGAAVAPALFAAECARLAYKKFDRDPAARDEVVAALAGVGYGDVAFFSVEGTDARMPPCMPQAERSSSRFAAPSRIRKDLATDARFVKVAWPGGGRVHGGFATAIEHVAPGAHRVAVDASRTRAVHRSQHGRRARVPRSLARDTLQRLVTFGCPRVGDAAFVATLARVAVERYVDCCDVVCRVPPAAFGFVHPVEPTYIDADGIVHTDLATMDVRADRRRAQDSTCGRTPSTS